LENAIDSFFGADSLQFTHFKAIDLSQEIILYPPSEDFRKLKAFNNNVESAKLYIQSRISELEEEALEAEHIPEKLEASLQQNTRNVFVVHGHDHGSKETVARFLTQLELDPIILHEKPNEGRTIIEKFEHHANVAFAVVILSPDDVGFAKNAPETKEQRARQNVIFELGFFVGKLGRIRTFALLLPGVTKPSDFDGVLYIPMQGDSWKMEIVRVLKAAGLDVDANKAY